VATGSLTHERQVIAGSLLGCYPPE
jgi:hypothetical protein